MSGAAGAQEGDAGKKARNRGAAVRGRCAAHIRAESSRLSSPNWPKLATLTLEVAAPCGRSTVAGLTAWGGPGS